LVVLGIFALFASLAVAGSLDYPYKERYRFVRSTWTSAETFYRNDLAVYGETMYRSLQNDNLNNRPDTSPTWWVETMAGPQGNLYDWWRSDIDVLGYAAGQQVYFNGHVYQKLIWYNGEVHQPDISPIYWQDLGSNANPFPFRAWGNLEFLDSALPLDQWYFAGGASVVGAAMVKADCHPNHWAEQEADNSGVGQFGLGPTVRMTDSNNFYKLSALGLDPDYPYFAFQLWRVKNGTWTLLYQNNYGAAQQAALKLGVSNNALGQPVLEMAFRYAGYDPQELLIDIDPWKYIGSYTDTSADAIQSGGKPGTWGYYPATEGMSHWSYGEYASPSPMMVQIVASAGQGGTISPLGTTILSVGVSQTYAITPMAGYHIKDIAVDGASQGPVTSYTFRGVNANHIISATFAANPSYTISANAGPNGAISPSGTVSVRGGINQKFTFTPAAGCRIADVQVDGTSVGVRTTYTFYNIQAAHTITAFFVLDVYSVNVTAATGGSVTVSGPSITTTTVNGGDSRMFTVNPGSLTLTVTPEPGRKVVSVIDNGAARYGVTAYTLTNIRKDHTINVYFR
jgi:hypothetical protein